MKQHFGCVKPKFPGAVGISVRNTHGWSLKQLSGCFSCNSKHSSGCSPCWSGVWQHSPLLSNLCSLSEAELSFSHLPFHGSKQWGNSRHFSDIQEQERRQKASLHQLHLFCRKQGLFSKLLFISLAYPRQISYLWLLPHIIRAYIHVNHKT